MKPEAKRALNSNQAFFPDELASIVEKLHYKDNFVFELYNLDRGQGSVGLTLVITIETPNSYDTKQIRRVAHYMPVPPAAFSMKSWRRWLLDMILLVERHEACEFFDIDGERPFAPLHGPGEDPYIIREMATDEERRTSYRGTVNPQSPGL